MAEVIFIFLILVVAITFHKNVLRYVADNILGKIIILLILLWFSSKSIGLALVFVLFLIISYEMMLNEPYEGCSTSIQTPSSTALKIPKKPVAINDRVSVENTVRMGKQSNSIPVEKVHNGENILPHDATENFAKTKKEGFKYSRIH